MATGKPADADPTATATFRRVAPGWAWLRDNFSLPAVLSIAGIVIAAGVGYLEQRADLKAIRNADPTQRLERLEADVKTLLEQHAADRQQLQDLAVEVAAQRAQWDRVEKVAESVPAPGRRRRP
jgi:hypothetical protein